MFPTVEDNSILFFSLLFAAIVIGWLLGRVQRNSPIVKTPMSSPALSKDYFVGLNYLVNEEPDRATEVFIKMLEVNSDTVEAHLALGNLFRSRGEVDKAIRLHQNIIARPSLSHEQRAAALGALAEDYLRSGLLDRAERIFLDLASSGQLRQRSLSALMEIYRQEKEWHKAIEVAQQLERRSEINIAHIIAHFYCELAELALVNEDMELAKRYIQRSNKQDRHCARASIILGDIYFRQGAYRQAIKTYRKLAQQEIDYLPEVLKNLSVCHKQDNSEDEYYIFLTRAIEEKAHGKVLLELCGLIKQREGLASAKEFLRHYLEQQPSLKGLHELIKLQLEEQVSTDNEFLLLAESVNRLVVDKPKYQCKGCGLTAKTLHWFCPSCRQWGLFKPSMGT